MNHLMTRTLAALLAAALAAPLAARTDTTFTFQGELKDGGALANGNYALDISLWDSLAGGVQIGATNVFAAVPVTDGRFTVQLDYGAAAFDNSDRWLQIVVNATPLTPRQPITRVPYSIQTRGIFVDDAGKVSVANDGGAASEFGLHSKLTNTNGGSSSAAIRGENASTTESGIGVWGSQDGDGFGVFGYTPTGIGIFGHSYGLTSGAFNEGVRGQVDNVSGYGVHGVATATGGPATGVYGTSASSSGNGVWGWATAASGSATGVLGRSDSPTGTAVRGFTTATTGVNHGVWGESTSGFGYGVFATNTSSFGTAMLGQESAEGGIGVWGLSQATTGNGIGVMGGSFSAAGFDFWANGAGVDFGSSSSRRWKRNIEDIDAPLYKLSKLRGVYYDWDEEHGGHHDIGMIAEEVGAVLPEIVQYEANGVDAIGMDYSKLTPLLVEAVKALRQEQQAELASLREENEALRIRLDALERMLELTISTRGLEESK